jgi:predicted ATP-dependent serine protease
MNLNLTKSAFQKVSTVDIPNSFYCRMKTGIVEFDELFGDGILPGCAMTFTGAAGAGKSTALLQMTEALANNGYSVGYASGEESMQQVAYTCRRLNVQNVQVANETDIDNLAAAMEDLDILVVDSFQALTTENKLNHAELERYAVTTLISAAKRTECAVVFVMHFTKSGNQLKGSTLVPHSVDVNFMITLDPDGDETQRVLSVYKNRYGRIGEYSAVMTSHGLQVTGKKEVVKAQSKSARKNQLAVEILKLDPPNITKQLVMQQFNLTASQAYITLKELQDSGKLLRYGRGQNAIFKKQIEAKQAVTA